MSGVVRIGVLLTTVVVLASCGGSQSSETFETVPTTALDSETTTSVLVTDAPGLGGTSWNVTLHLDQGSMAELWPGTEITIEFGEDGSVSGSGGCNTYTGTFAVDGPYDEFEEGVRDENDGQAINIGIASVTEIGCTEPGGIMDQESEFLSALESSGRWVIARGNLSLRDSEGFFLVEAEPGG